LSVPDEGATYAMFATVEENAARPNLPSHVEVLLDRQGYLRARWVGIPDDGAKQTAAILDQVAVLNEEPPHEVAPESHMH